MLPPSTVLPAPAGAFPPLRHVLWGGLLLRLAIYPLLPPTNVDDHFSVITFIRDHGRVPFADELSQAYHPPLYYVLALPLAWIDGPKLVQALSIALSCANLVLLFLLIRETPLLRSERARLHALLAAAVLPVFVVHSALVSNDSLSYLIGTACILLAFRYLEESTGPRLIALAIALAAGLLTKGTFLGWAIALACIVGLEQWRRHGGRRAAVVVLVFVALSGTLGSYKFIENTMRLGRPLVHNMSFEPEWAVRQEGTWQGVSTLLDINVWRLIEKPARFRPVQHSIPLLLYGSTWYPLKVTFGWQATRFPPTIPRILYVAGVVPALLVIGGVLLLAWFSRTLVHAPRLTGDDYFRRVHALTLLLVIGGTFGVVISAGLRFDAWSSFSGRLLFPSMGALCVSLGVGLGRLPDAAARGMGWALWFAWGASLVYFAVECRAALEKLLAS